jgi:serine/threonine protein kinase
VLRTACGTPNYVAPEVLAKRVCPALARAVGGQARLTTSGTTAPPGLRRDSGRCLVLRLHSLHIRRRPYKLPPIDLGPCVVSCVVCGGACACWMALHTYHRLTIIQKTWRSRTPTQTYCSARSKRSVRITLARTCVHLKHSQLCPGVHLAGGLHHSLARSCRGSRCVVSHARSSNATHCILVARCTSQVSSTLNNFSVRCRHIDLIGRILVPDPAKRITMAQIKQHPWFAVYVHHRTRYRTHARARARTHTHHS